MTPESAAICWFSVLKMPGKNPTPLIPLPMVIPAAVRSGVSFSGGAL
jgi:hypothetical protein